MGKKSGPPAPDYAAAAREEGAQSVALTEAQTKANRPDIVTPWGSQTWQQNGDKWTQTTQLSPEEQSALDSQQNIQQGRSQAAETLLGQASQSFQTPMNWNSLPARAGAVNAPQFAATPNLDPSVANSSFSQGRGTVGPFGFGGGIQSGIGQGDIQGQLDATPAQYRDQAQEAVWNLQKPQLAQQREGLEVQLANQGLARGSEAWTREMNRQDDSEARARLMAISEGRNEAGQMFGQGLQSGQFRNAAQNQDFSQDLSAGEFGNRAQTQMFGQGQSYVDQANRIGNQEFAQNQSQAQFENSAQQQQFQNLLQAAQFGDQRAVQQLQAQLQAFGFNNQNRQSAIAEETMRRGQPLNELNALLTGQQVNMPNAPDFKAAGKAQTPDLLGAANSQYNAALDRQNSRNGFLGNLANIGASAFSFSDARLKEDISYTGGSIGGVPVVHYRYRGLPGLQIGVIAQDVLRIRPSAVALHASGYLMVDYSELCS